MAMVKMFLVKKAGKESILTEAEMKDRWPTIYSTMIHNELRYVKQETSLYGDMSFEIFMNQVEECQKRGCVALGRCLW